MTGLKRAAHLALEGSNRAPDAMIFVRDYLTDLLDRSLQIGDVDLNVEIGALLRLLRELSDPHGNSPYQLKIARRHNVGRAPNPLEKRYRAISALFAAYYADKMLTENPAMQKKEANSLAAEAFKVTIPEIYAARRTDNYKMLSASI